VAPQAAASKEPMKQKTPRVNWAQLLSRTLAIDVFACVRCGGRLQSAGVREMAFRESSTFEAASLLMERGWGDRWE
jgi:hypothetical protein